MVGSASESMFAKRVEEIEEVADEEFDEDESYCFYYVQKI